jgi:hypothetical protein
MDIELPELGTHWINHKNDVYTVIGITNINADDNRRKDWPIQVVYVGHTGLIWGMSIDLWFHKMKGYNGSLNQLVYGEQKLTLQEVLDETPDPYDTVEDLVNHTHRLLIENSSLYARVNEQNTVSYSFNVLKQAVHEDIDYAWAWHSNMAMACYDAGADHTVANYGAVRFMWTLFEVDTEPLLERAGIQQPERTSDQDKSNPDYIYDRVVATADRAVEWLLQHNEERAKELIAQWQKKYIII